MIKRRLRRWLRKNLPQPTTCKNCGGMDFTAWMAHTQIAHTRWTCNDCSYVHVATNGGDWRATKAMPKDNGWHELEA